MGRKMITNFIYAVMRRKKVFDCSVDYQELSSLLEELPKNMKIRVNCAFYGKKFRDNLQKVAEFVDVWFNPTPNSSESFSGRHRIYRKDKNKQHIIDLKQISSCETIRGTLEYTCSG